MMWVGMHFPRRGWIALLPLPEERAFFSELKHHLFEGAELPVLQGARRTLVAHRPQLAISIYHSKQDMVRIPLWLESVLKGYRHFLGHYSSTYWDTVWYAVPEERLPRRAR